MVHDRRTALLGNCIEDNSKMAISYMIWFRLVTKLIRLGFLDLLEELPNT